MIGGGGYMSQERLPRFLKFSWGMGATGTTSMLYLINLFLIYFLVRHVGLSAALAGGLLAVTRVYDAVINPLIGAASDRTESRFGRRKPWMLAGAILAPLGCIAIFNPPAALEGNALTAYVFAALLLYLTAYSLFAIPFIALGTELSDDYRERASVMAYRTFFVYVSGLVIASGAPALVAMLGKDRAAYATMSWAAAAVVAVAMLWPVVFTGQARVVTPRNRPLPFAVWWRTAFTNLPYILILLSKLTLQLGTAFAGAASLFFMTYVLGRGESALALFGSVGSVVGLATVPLWNRILQHVERKPFFTWLLAVNFLGYLSWWLATPDEPTALFVLRAIVMGAAGSGAVLVSTAMITDAIEYDRLTTGQRREGVFLGGFELVQTTSFVIGPLVVGFVLSGAGLVPGQVSAAEQPPEAIAMIRNAMATIPAVTCVVGMFLLMFYRLTAQRLADLRADGAVAPESP
ncbi:MAG: hypothetical protein RL603_2140 [Pseudomonadota bacterium]